MYISTDDARSDFVLAAAAPIFGTLVVRFLARTPLYPLGLAGDLLLLVWVALMFTLPPRFLARTRGQGIEAFGLDRARSGLGDGLLLAAPLLAAGYVRSFSPSGVLGGLLGRLVSPLSGNPLVSTPSLVDTLYFLVLLVLAGTGGLWLYGLLTVRARDAFRQLDIPLLQALRTFGLGAVGIGTLLGLMLALAQRDRAVWTVLLDSGAMVAVILITDRLVGSNDRTGRATVLAPMITVVVTYVLGSGAGLFGGDLATALYRGAMAASLVAVIAVLIETRRAAWAAVPLVAVSMWVQTCVVFPVPPFTYLSC